MFKVIALYKRKPGLSVEDFGQYWRSTHAPRVARCPQIRRHVISCALPQGYRKGELLFDGVGETWFESASAYEAYHHAVDYPAIAADRAIFLDQSRTVLMPVDVHVARHGAVFGNSVKNIEFITRKPGTTPAAFSRYWRDVHGPIAARIPAIQRYEQNHLKPKAYAAAAVAPRYDGIAVAWFPSTAHMRDGAATPQYAATRADEPNFLHPELPIIIAREHVIVGD